MTPGTLLLTMAGVVIAGGLVSLVAAVRGVSLLPPKEVRSGGRHLRVHISPIGATAMAAGLLTLLFTGWPVGAVGVAAAVMFVPSVFGGGKAAQMTIARADALAFWTRRVADLLASGAAGSIQQALRKSQSSADEPISDAVTRLTERMGPRGLEPALRMFADEIGDASAEQAAGILILRERNGGPGVADALTALANDLDERARMLRDVEAERAKPRSSMRAIVLAVSALILLMLLFLRPVLSFYSTVPGQLSLAVIVAVFALGLRWMKRLSMPRTTAIVLTGTTRVPGDI